MDELTKMFTSPAFWVGSVLAAIVINFCTQWAYGRLADLGSNWAQVRSNRSKAEFERDLKFVMSDERALPIVTAREARERSFALLWLLFSCMFLLFTLLVRTSLKLPLLAAIGWPANFLSISACLMLLSAVIAVKRASRWQRVIETFARYVEVDIAASKEQGAKEGRLTPLQRENS